MSKTYEFETEIKKVPEIDGAYIEIPVCINIIYQAGIFNFKKFVIMSQNRANLRYRSEV